MFGKLSTKLSGMFDSKKTIENEKWFEINIPKPMSADFKDWVTYQIVNLNNNKIEADFKNEPCYSYFFNNYSRTNCIPGNYKIRLLPQKILLSEKDFSKWFDLCKSHNFMPENWIVNSTDQIVEFDYNSNYLGSHKRIYSGLCCYRYSQINPETVYKILRLHELKPEMPFLQVFHYGMATRRVISNYNGGHDFHHVYHSENIYTKPVQGWYLPYGMVLKHFFKKDSQADKDLKSFSCAPNIKSYLASLNYIETPTSIGKFTKPEEVLNPKLSKLYELEEMPERTEFERIFQEVTSGNNQAPRPNT